MNAPKRLLIIDDDSGIRRQLRWAFDSFEVLLAEDRESGLEIVRQERPPIVLLDLGLPPDVDGPTEGLAALGQILSIAPRTKVIVMTGQAERTYAVDAVASGAYDFYQKPIEIEILQMIVSRADRLYQLEMEYDTRVSGANSPLPNFLCANPNTLKILEKVREFARTDISVLILGESGTGKEVIARAIHDLGSRSTKQFVALNCAAIPDQLLESELFGHEKGAFTGALKTTRGRVELADGGTLFLDEIGDLSMALQAKLLRFLQERVIERVGGHQTIEVDVRVVSATNKNLEAAMKDGEFREDLYYRLNEFSVELPPLRERPDDTIVIANHFLTTFATEQSRPVRGFSHDALVAISNHEWPGNVRELQNRIKSAVVTARHSKVTASDLDLGGDDQSSAQMTLKDARNEAEKRAIRMALLQTNDNISNAAKILDVSRPKLYDLMRQHDMKP